LKIACAWFGLLAGCLAGAAHGGVAATADIGTTGIGAHAAIALRPDLNLRIGAGYFDYSWSRGTGYLKYDFKLKGNTFDVLLDWYPREHGAFRLSVGAAYNGNKVDARARPEFAGSYLIGGRIYELENVGRIDGRIDFRKVAPYVGIGWGRGGAQERGWAFSSDFGLLFHGKPRTSLSSSGCTIFSLVCDYLAQDLRRENQELSDKASRYRVYPVIRFGIGYAF
jgi:hypothetical protein